MRHSWLKLGSNQWRCTCCNMLKKLETIDGKYGVYYYDGRGQRHDVAGKCKRID